MADTDQPTACPNCPPGYDCWTGNYLTAQAADSRCAPEAWGCGYPECECDRDYPCADLVTPAAGGSDG